MVKSSGRAGGEQEMGGAREKIKTALRKARVVGRLIRGRIDHKCTVPRLQETAEAVDVQVETVFCLEVQHTIRFLY